MKKQTQGQRRDMRQGRGGQGRPGGPGGQGGGQMKKGQIEMARKGNRALLLLLRAIASWRSLRAACERRSKLFEL